MSTAQHVITALGLEPHGEGGFFKRIYCHDDRVGDRALASSIYYLLEGGLTSKLHRFDADEIWCWHDGAPLSLDTGIDPNDLHRQVLGTDLSIGQRPQLLVPANHWQQARSEGDWTLVSCIVSPEFLFDTFELKA